MNEMNNDKNVNVYTNYKSNLNNNNNDSNNNDNDSNNNDNNSISPSISPTQSSLSNSTLDRAIIGSLFMDERPLSRVTFGPAATRRLEAISTMTSQAFQNYNPLTKYTLYNSKTGLLGQFSEFPLDEIQKVINVTNSDNYANNSNNANNSSFASPIGNNENFKRGEKSFPIPSSPLKFNEKSSSNVDQNTNNNSNSNNVNSNINLNSNSINNLNSNIENDGFLWIDLCRPTDADLSQVQDAFKIHPLTIEDITVRDNREKCEIFERYLFICIRSLQQQNHQSSSFHSSHSNSDARGSFSFHSGHSSPLSQPSLPLHYSENRNQNVNGNESKSRNEYRNGNGNEYRNLDLDGNLLTDSHSSKKKIPLIDGLAEPLNLYILLFQSCILSIHSEAMPNQIRHVLMRIFPLKSILYGIKSDWVMYSLLDDIVDEFEPICTSMEMETDSIDELVLVLSRSDQAEMLRRIGRARRLTTQLQRLLRPKGEILRTLIKKTLSPSPSSSNSNLMPSGSDDNIGIHNEINSGNANINASAIKIQFQTTVYLRDIQDHLFVMLQSLEHSSETLNRAHSNYLAQIGIEQNEHNNHMNIVMKNATVIAAIMLPISAISGIWGMNVPVPGTMDFNRDPLPFITISLLMILVMVTMYAIGRRQRWF